LRAFRTNSTRPHGLRRVEYSTTDYIFERPFVKRFALCYRSVVCPVCLSVCPVCDVRAVWPNGWMDQDETWHAGRPRPWPRPRPRFTASSSTAVPAELSTRSPSRNCADRSMLNSLTQIQRQRRSSRRPTPNLQLYDRRQAVAVRDVSLSQLAPRVHQFANCHRARPSPNSCSSIYRSLHR